MNNTVEFATTANMPSSAFRQALQCLFDVRERPPEWEEGKKRKKAPLCINSDVSRSAQEQYNNN